jgi:hypothetical protein
MRKNAYSDATLRNDSMVSAHIRACRDGKGTGISADDWRFSTTQRLDTASASSDDIQYLAEVCARTGARRCKIMEKSAAQNSVRRTLRRTDGALMVAGSGFAHPHVMCRITNRLIVASAGENTLVCCCSGVDQQPTRLRAPCQRACNKGRVASNMLSGKEFAEHITPTRKTSRNGKLSQQQSQPGPEARLVLPLAGISCQCIAS